MADAQTPRAAKTEVLGAFGRIDILVNNAGGSQPVALHAPDEVWAGGFEVNFAALRRLAETFLPSMRERGYGRIINIGGTHEPMGMNVTGAAKAAAQFWARALADEVARSGITVNTIVPGWIKAEQIQKQYPTEEAFKAFEALTLMGYLGEPEDVASLVALLASPRGRYITGVVVYVDGGRHRYAF